MRAAHRVSALASYRDAVAERFERGESFAAVEEAIDDAGGLTEDEGAALWLYAFALRDKPRHMHRRTRLAAVPSWAR